MKRNLQSPAHVHNTVDKEAILLKAIFDYKEMRQSMCFRVASVASILIIFAIPCLSSVAKKIQAQYKSHQHSFERPPQSVEDDNELSTELENGDLSANQQRSKEVQTAFDSIDRKILLKERHLRSRRTPPLLPEDPNANTDGSNVTAISGESQRTNQTPSDATMMKTRDDNRETLPASFINWGQVGVMMQNPALQHTGMPVLMGRQQAVGTTIGLDFDSPATFHGPLIAVIMVCVFVFFLVMLLCCWLVNSRRKHEKFMSEKLTYEKGRPHY